MTKKAAKRERDLKAIAQLVAYHIDETDWYGDYAHIKHLDYTVIRDSEFGDIMAYMLWTDTGEFIRGLRSGVVRARRGQGLSVKLYKQIGAMARRRGKKYKTYSALSNIASLNAHFKAGMKIEKVVPYEGGFTAVHLTT